MKNLFDTFQEARKYFEVIAAYNVDRFRFQSMISTAHKLTSLSAYIRNGVVVEELAKGVESVSDYWFYKTLHSPLFKDYRDAFLLVQSWAEEQGLEFNREADSFHTDTFCNHLLVKNPHNGGYELFRLDDGQSFQADTYVNCRPQTPATLTMIQGASVPVYNFTRRECSVRTSAPIGHQVAH